jgi:hypothetical protein
MTPTTIEAAEPQVPGADEGSTERTTGSVCQDLAASTTGLPALLAEVAVDGWNGGAGRQAIEVMRRACRREATRWTKTAGWLTDEGLSAVWEQMDRLVRTKRVQDAPGLLPIVVRRVYAGEAAAAQTGMGSPTTRGLIGAVQRREAASAEEYGFDDTHSSQDEPASMPPAPPWMRTLAAVLAAEGWRWPVPALHAVMASAAGAAQNGRRNRSVLAAHDTGIPAATWSALDLLTVGSGPGCQPESRAPGVSVQIDLLGAAGIRGNNQLMRIVTAAVQGRPVRTGRQPASAA